MYERWLARKQAQVLGAKAGKGDADADSAGWWEAEYALPAVAGLADDRRVAAALGGTAEHFQLLVRGEGKFKLLHGPICGY